MDYPEIFTLPAVSDVALQHSPLGCRMSAGSVGAPELDVELQRVATLAGQIESEGGADILHLGIGGSAWGTQALAAAAGPQPSRLHVLDTTAPQSVFDLLERLDPRRTFVTIASKSGETLETDSLRRVVVAWLTDGVGAGWAKRVAVITTRGTPLDSWARDHLARALFLNPVEIGGRFSALTFFGLVPAVLAGVDGAAVVAVARDFAKRSLGGPRGDVEDPRVLGQVLGRYARLGRWKLTIQTSPPLRSFGHWLEQLFAESTGKQGSGILPVLNEPLAHPEQYSADRVFVVFDQNAVDSAPTREWASALGRAGHPVYVFDLDRAADVGQEFVRWEIACVAACRALGINPFSQPAVDEVKVRMTELLRAEGDLRAFRDSEPERAGRFLASADPDEYLALVAYAPYGARLESGAEALRRMLLEERGLTTTFDYAPRSLHTSGQFHKDGRRGDVIQFHEAVDSSGAVPGRPFSLAEILVAAQIADSEALRRRGRRVVSVNLAHTDWRTLQRAAAGLGAGNEGGPGRPDTFTDIRRAAAR